MKQIPIFLIKTYKRFISPVLPNSCRFYPSCSQYAIDALSEYGLIKGSMKAIYRIIRCNPLNRGGYDPAK